jgi:hypothetical protein
MQKERAKRAPKKILRDLFGHSNNALIRKYFSRAVRVGLTPDKEFDQSLTPYELSEYIQTQPISESVTNMLHSDQEFIPSEEDANHEEMQNTQNVKMQITEHYEKARYSNEECTKEEVLFVKKLLNKSKPSD